MMGVERHELFEGVYWLIEHGSRVPATLNMDRGFKIYGERLVNIEGIEYREWVPFRSKLSAAIMTGLKELPIRRGSKVLYLGSATGTTLSHVSDIVESEGVIFAVDFAHRVMVQFLEKVAKRRCNVVPLFEDARRPEDYAFIVDEVDVVYCDVAQPEQARILADNCHAFLRRGGQALFAVKSRSIDSVEDPERVYRREISLLESEGLRVIERVDLEPFERDHVMVRAVYE